MSSTETGVIFGNIFYDGAATTDSRCVVLNDIHIDILDYITPGYCNEAQVSSFVLPQLDRITLQMLTPFCTVPKHVDRVRVGEQGQRQHEP